MANFVFCSECGTKLVISRKGMPAYGRIIDLVNPHVCTEEPIEPDLGMAIPITVYTEKGKFVQKLNELHLPKFESIDSERLRDRRTISIPSGVEIESDIRSTAPNSVLRNFESLNNPDHEVTGEEDME